MDVLSLYQVNSYERFLELFVCDDQELMKSGKWDVNNLDLPINKARQMLLELEDDTLPIKDELIRRHALWLWYHHAISWAVYHEHRPPARYYAREAMKYNVEGGNEITYLLWLLVHDRYKDAKSWVQKIRRDKETALAVLADYENNSFWGY